MNKFYFVIIFSLVSFALVVSFDEASAYSGKGKTSNQDSERYVQQLNKYANYVHFQPEWKSYPYNVIFDVSTSWSKKVEPVTDNAEEFEDRGAKSRVNSLQFTNGKPFVEVQYDYTDCKYMWIHYSATALHFLNHQVGFFMGNQKNSDPNSAYYPTIPNEDHSLQVQQEKLREGFAQFIPICTSNEITSYEYAIKSDEKDMAFDVYFVPSVVEKWNYFNNKSEFKHYTEEGCYGQNFKSYSGSCNNVSENGGLLVVVPDEFSKPVTKFSIKMQEKWLGISFLFHEE